jgi:hypothetical protein
MQLNKFNISLASKQLFNRYAVKKSFGDYFAIIVDRLRRKRKDFIKSQLTVSRYNYLNK